MKIFDYCESVSLPLIEQPFNAFSSFGFILGALLLYRYAKKHDLLGIPQLRKLILIGGVIGIGSFIWHTHLSILTFAFDVIPIFSFLILYQWIWYREFTSFTTRQRVIAIGILLLAMGGASLVYESIFLQKSNAFIPLTVWLLVTMVQQRRLHTEMACMHGAAATVLWFAILMRMIDVPVCPHLHDGTHYLWHLLCALALYIVTLALMKARRAHA